MSPNLSSVVHVHPLYVVVAHKSKMEVSPGGRCHSTVLKHISSDIVRQIS